MKRYNIISVDDIYENPRYVDLSKPPTLGYTSRYEGNKGHLILISLPQDPHVIETVIVDEEEQVSNKDLTFLEVTATSTPDGIEVVTKGRKKREKVEKKKKPVTPEMYEQRRKFLQTLDQEKLRGARLTRDNRGYGVLELIEFARRLGIERGGKKKTQLALEIRKVLDEYGMLKVPLYEPGDLQETDSGIILGDDEGTEGDGGGDVTTTEVGTSGTFLTTGDASGDL